METAPIDYLLEDPAVVVWNERQKGKSQVAALMSQMAAHAQKLRAELREAEKNDNLYAGVDTFGMF